MTVLDLSRSNVVYAVHAYSQYLFQQKQLSRGEDASASAKDVAVGAAKNYPHVAMCITLMSKNL